MVSEDVGRARMESGSQGWDETNSFESNLTSLTRAANSAAIPASDDKPDVAAAACMVSEDV